MIRFWSSVDLTGNQTITSVLLCKTGFWSSVDLTGNQTYAERPRLAEVFWSSVDLTGNQTSVVVAIAALCFGAVSI